MIQLFGDFRIDIYSFMPFAVSFHSEFHNCIQKPIIPSSSAANYVLSEKHSRVKYVFNEDNMVIDA